MNIFFLVGTKKRLKAAVYKTSLLIRKASENLLYLQILPPGQNIQPLICICF